MWRQKKRLTATCIREGKPDNQLAARKDKYHLSDATLFLEQYWL